MKKKLNELEYTLKLLDDYDHQCIEKTTNNTLEKYKISYEDVLKIINSMNFSESSNVFGVEKEKGIVQGILNNIYQSSFGIEIYESVEEKAANLLYFLIKDHPFVDGCKRIATAVFIYYLSMNNIEEIDKKMLVPLVLLIAHSSNFEKELMINLILKMIK
ncbi:type II toxin-antitoxin system death-on-curing family toxin [Streptobacillus canis]|uniref:type II toxin-antitoxin system death-on-curing family toxin n=1 Tax=Streptobacillus canis TaxID=2678686 RepID=UPI0012E1178F|nr:Fic family protein [Streptobacillus canis]